MPDTTLRSRLIRLAAVHPELRADILPLLKEAAGPSYKDYVDRKRNKGEKPLAQDAWESRVMGKGKGDSKKSVSVGGESFAPDELADRRHEIYDAAAAMQKSVGGAGKHPEVDTAFNALGRVLDDIKSKGKNGGDGAEFAADLDKAHKALSGAVSKAKAKPKSDEKGGTGKAAALRSRLIRLAAVHPELRADLLPLLAGHASLRRAGLFDRTLVAKAVQYVILKQGDDGTLSAFEYDERTRISTREVSAEYEVDYRGDDITINIGVDVPVGAMVFMDFVLPAKLVLQVPTAQREEFMLEVLNLVTHKIKPLWIVQGAMGGKSGLQQLLRDGNSGALDFIVDGVLPNARMSAPEQAGRFVIRGNEARFPVKFKATYELSWDWGNNMDVEAYMPEPSFDEPDPDDFDPGAADRYFDRY